MKFFIVICLVATLGVSNSGFAQPETLRIALIDGKNIAYAKAEDCVEVNTPECPETNTVVLARILPSLFPSYTIETMPFHVRVADDNSVYPLASNVLEFEPDIVLMHWSSFEILPERQCDPRASGRDGECAVDIVNFWAQIFEQRPSVDFLIYSRKSGICENYFGEGLREMVYDHPTVDEDGLASNVGLLAFSKESEFRNFYLQRGQIRLTDLMSALIDDEQIRLYTKSDGLCILRNLS